ncbi:ankyrin repeat domain-containing protein [bacterium]|nr:ankyrin repeat domain-containing protein [bacterium]
MAQKSGKGPNYALIAGLGVVGAGICGGVGHFALKLGTTESGGLAALGLLLFAGAGLIPSFGGDAKRLAAQVAVKKNVDAAYQSQSLGKLEQAEKLLLEALDRGQILGPSDLSILAATHSLGNLYRLQNKFDKAEEKYRLAIKTYEELGKTDDQNFAHCLRDCAFSLESRGRTDESVAFATRALALSEKLGHTRDVAEIMSLIARNTRASGLFQQAIETYQRVKDLQLKQFGENSPEVIDTVVTTARCMRSLNQLNEAMDNYKDALVRTNKAERPSRNIEAEALLEMAEVSLAQGAFKNVEPLCLGSLKVLQAYVGPKEKLLVRLAAATKEAREKLGQPFAETEFIWLFTQNRDQVRDLFRENAELAKQKDRTGWGPVQWTMFLGWEDLMRWLMRNGGQSDGFEDSIMSPVHVAAAFSKGGTITFLHEQGVALDVIGPQGWGAVHFASYHGRADCVEQLLARGCQADILDKMGRSPLHLAADRGHNELVSLLLNKGLDKDAQDTKYGRTPLHYAAGAGHGAVVRTLMTNGANENVADKAGKTPIQLAEEGGHRGLMTAMKHFRSAMES